jgi:DNA-binding Lrp family transcriptional regulator
MRGLDKIDCQILAALQKNARLPNKVLAARVGIAQSTCLERVRRLHEQKILKSFHAEVEPKALGIGLQAMLGVQFGPHTEEQVAAFRQHILQLPEVVAFYHVAGGKDFLLQVAVRDSDHLRQLALSAFSARTEVANVDTSLIFEHVTSSPLPVFLAEETL